MNLKELQKENLVLNQEIDRLKKENELLRESLFVPKNMEYYVNWVIWVIK